MDKFNFILEHKYKDYINIEKNNKILLFIKNYLQPIIKNDNNIFLSLSLGVDSACLFFIFIELRKILNFNLHVAHVNYRNRPESNDECQFIINLCEKYNIIPFINIMPIVRKNISREEYEKKTNIMRYDFYKDILNSFNSNNGFFLAHIKDDKVENIFSNILNGRSILDLEVFQYNNIVNGVQIHRPLLDTFKSDLFTLAHKHNIPYFKNSTPTWARRYIMRFLVFPFLTEKFGNFIPNLLNIGKQSSDCSKTINRTIIEPFFRENIKFNKNGIYFEINNDIKNFEDTIWNIIFTKIFHDLFSHPRPSNNSIENFIKTIKSSRNEGFINLSKDFECYFKNNIYFIYNNKNIENKKEIINTILE